MTNPAPDDILFSSGVWMLLKNYKEWRDKMENKILPGRVEHISQGINTAQQDSVANRIQEISDNRVDTISFAKHSVVFLRTKSGPNGLYYNANVIVSIKETYERELLEEKSQKEYWRSRCEDVQSNYNLQQRNAQRTEETIRDYEEKIIILSEALTRAKMSERGKKIYISRLQNQLKGKSSRRSR